MSRTWCNSRWKDKLIMQCSLEIRFKMYSMISLVQQLLDQKFHTILPKIRIQRGIISMSSESKWIWGWLWMQTQERSNLRIKCGNQHQSFSRECPNSKRTTIVSSNCPSLRNWLNLGKRLSNRANNNNKSRQFKIISWMGDPRVKITSHQSNLINCAKKIDLETWWLKLMKRMSKGRGSRQCISSKRSKMCRLL